jgi:NADPH-dependent 2,4-dienoyl-CoA reductase/sulfur reductase-like enzyme/predicted acylesterase/phospholipase RssA
LEAAIHPHFAMTKNTVRRHFDHLLVGGGLASASAAETLRAEGALGTIAIVGAESRPPYHRPPLSKRIMLAGHALEPPPVLQPDDFRRLRIDLFTDTRVVAVEPQRHIVRTDRGDAIRYGKLLIATGAKASHLAVPGARLGGIHTLRTADDAHALSAAGKPGTRAVVIGASFIALEASATLCQKGVSVTLLVREEGLLDTLHDASITRFFSKLYAERGIKVVFGEVASFGGLRGDAGDQRVAAVTMRDGSRHACDFVVVGIGASPDVGFLEGSGIDVDGGVLVDSQLRASAPDVFAAGDAASYLDPVTNLRKRVEHADNAIRQGRLVARNMLGHHLPYDQVSGFFCDVFDTSFQVIGMPEEATEHVHLGRTDGRSWAVLYLHDQVPRALFTLGRPAAETRSVQALIRYRTNVARLRADFDKPGFSLAKVPSQTVLLLQGGGALGAFEAGVVRALERKGIHPDIVAGVSIGAFNGAIVAAHPRHAAQALEAFWHDLAMATPELPDDRARRLVSSFQTIFFGVPGFFIPRWLTWPLPFQAGPSVWTSFYDSSPALELLERYIDFKALRTSPVRLLLSAVRVETAELEIFDSHVDDLRPEHILASGSLPPGLPWTTIGKHHYWDGGIVSNSPLEQVIERCGASGKRLIVVDLFAQNKPLPVDMAEVLTRRDEIVYAERVRRTGNEQAVLEDFRKLVDDILEHMEPAAASQMRQRPRYVELMGAETQSDVLRIVRESRVGMPASQDLDFSRSSIDMHMRAGHAAAIDALAAAQRHVARVAYKARP